jgi:hypothetical protein
MRCPKCQAEFDDNAEKCPVCAKAPSKNTRRRTQQSADPHQIKEEELGNPTARRAYYCALYGLIPFLGLLLGPLALVFGWSAWRQEKAKAGRGRTWPAFAILLFGVAITLSNWLGVAMMVYGLAFAEA